DLRIPLPDLFRGARSFIGLRRRHAHVDDGDIGLRADDGVVQRRCIAGLSNDLETGVLKDAREPFAEQQRVFGDYDSHGISPMTVVPLPAGLSMCRVPPSASIRSARPRSPEPLAAFAPP